MIIWGLRVAAVATFVLAVTGLSAYSSESGFPVASSSANAQRILLAQPKSRRSDAMPAGTSSLKSVLNVRRPMRFGQYMWDDRNVPTGPVEIRVDLATQIISVSRAGHEIGTAVILYGADEKPTPLGRFPILERRKKHRSSLYDADMPYTLRLTNDGIAIHGSDVRRNAATHGCIGVPMKFAALLFDEIKVADNVFIVGA